MPAPYSTRFIAATGIGPGSSASYTVPAGQTAIVHCITAIGDGFTAGTGLASIHGVCSFAVLYPTAARAGDVWTGRMVLNAGETLQLSSAAGTLDLAASGYLLTD